MEFVPENLYHDAENPFTLHGFKYRTMAHYLVVQIFARRDLPFKHFFNMDVKDLPYIHCVNRKVLEEGLDAMLPEMSAKAFKYPISHDLLGIGTTKFRLKYGDKETGKNVYGIAMRSVLKRREKLLNERKTG